APGRRSATVAAGLALAAVVVLCLGVSGCGGESGEGSRSAETEAAELDSVAAAAADETGLPVLLDLGSTTCVPCKAMAPILDEMRETFAGQFDVRFVNVKEDATLAREYGVRIIPTQIYLDEQGNELFRHQGFFSREDMLAAWEELGYVFEE
ncbi:MAG: thioredoxin family protein, partial [Candidatus Eisenbacteria bacterium]